MKWLLNFVVNQVWNADFVVSYLTQRHTILPKVTVMNVSMIQSLINAIEKPAIFIDHNYVIKAKNKAYADHYQNEIHLGKSRCFEISHHVDQPCDKYGEDCPLISCKATNQNQRVLHIHSDDNKSKEYCDIVMRPVVNDDGITVGFLEILDKVSYASHQSDNEKLIGVSPAFKQMIEMINRCAKSDISILLHGDTGTGKELAANAIHHESERKNKALIIVECTGLSEALFESELFGHEKGAFTGANVSKKGLIDLAQDGTLFLDEIGDIPLSLQVKLLRLLETGTYRSVGGMEVKKADFRLVCASHKDLLAMVNEGTFRRDLYYRLAAFPIYLPSLTQRKEDIPLLAEHYLAQSKYHYKSFTESALLTLKNYEFPGNIRELKNIVDRAVLMNDTDFIDVQCLGLVLPIIHKNESQASNQVQNDSLEEHEKQYLQKICTIYQGESVQKMANILGVSQRTFYRKLQHHHIELHKNKV